MKPLFDCHFHTTESDGVYSPSQAIDEAKRYGLEFIACTDHDTITRDIVQMARNSWIDAVQGVEISVREGEKNIHMTTYSQNFSSRVDEVLDTVNAGRRHKVSAQIDRLRSIWFMIDDDSFASYWNAKGMSLITVGNGHIAKYLFPEETEYADRKEKNLRVYREITGSDEVTFKKMVWEHLKPSGSHPFGAVEVPPYEPQIRDMAEHLENDRTIRSVAHSHLNYSNVGRGAFAERIIPLIREKAINALEIHSSATPDWIQAYLDIRERTGILLTFGSDCHFDRIPGSTHTWIGELNQHVDASLLRREFDRFRNYLAG